MRLVLWGWRSEEDVQLGSDEDRFRECCRDRLREVRREESLEEMCAGLREAGRALFEAIERQAAEDARKLRAFARLGGRS